MTEETETDSTKEKVQKKAKKSKTFILGGIAVLVLVIFAGCFYFFYHPSEKVKGGKLVAKNDIKTAKPPFKPRLEAPITGDYNKDSEICRWFVNGDESTIKTKPVDGKCVLSHIKLAGKGAYKIHYQIVGTGYTSEDIVVDMREKREN